MNFNIDEVFRVEYLINIAWTIQLLIIGYIALRLTKWILNKNIDKIVNNVTLQGFFKSVINVLYILAITILILTVIGIKNSTYLPGLIIGVGTAIGFALRDNLKTVINGVIIILSRPFVVGDIVTIENTYGYVAEINIFHVKIITLENKTIIVDNGIVFRNAIIKIDTGEDIRQGITVTIDNNYCSIKNTVKHIEQAIKECPLITKKDNSKIIVNERGCDCTEFVIHVWSNPMNALQVKSSINKCVSILLEKEYTKKFGA